MRFKDFIAEDADLQSQPSSEKISLTAAKKWVKEHARVSMKKIIEGKRIYRGQTAPGAYLLGDSNSFTRKSLNHKNFYTKFFSHSAKWKDYPNREHSFICASSITIAEGYGKLFLVIPADDANIGICDASDIWRSFPRLEYALDIRSLSVLNNLLYDLFIIIEGHEPPEDIIANMKKWDMKIIEDVANRLSKSTFKSTVSRYDVVTIVSLMNEHSFKSFYDLLDWLLDPEDNKLSHAVMKDLNNLPKHREVWIQGKMIFLSETVWDDFIETMQKELDA